MFVRLRSVPIHSHCFGFAEARSNRHAHYIQPACLQFRGVDARFFGFVQCPFGCTCHSLRNIREDCLAARPATTRTSRSMSISIVRGAERWRFEEEEGRAPDA